MDRTRLKGRTGRLLLRLFLLAAGAAAVASATLSDAGAARGGSLAVGVLPGLILLASLAGLHRPWGGTALGLGALALPMAAVLGGPAAAGWVGGGAALVSGLFALSGRHGGPDGLLGALATAGRVALAAAAAAALWDGLGMPGAQTPLAEVFAGGAVAGGAYLVCSAALARLDAAGLEERPPILRPLALDLAGWAFGTGLAAVTLRMEWPLGLGLLGGTALLALEAHRSAALGQRSERRAHDLRRVAGASHRLAARADELGSIAERVREECRGLVPFQWFHFQLLGGPGAAGSWRARGDDAVEEGIPAPPPYPPALPGVHRRMAWQVVSRDFALEGEPIARLSLWCDPRVLDREGVELLDAVLPQMAASVHGSLLAARADRDALTGIADRGVLEDRLERALARCCEEGTPVAVVMCDIDHFKRINDAHGHAAGDEALVAVAQLIQGHCRDRDLCCRYGGEEFTLLLDRTDGPRALAIAERLRRAAGESRLLVEGQRVPLTLSLGVAAFPDLYVRAGRELLDLADQALYEAKKRGRDRALLNLGQARFQRADGRVVGSTRPPEVATPSLFA